MRAHASRAAFKALHMASLGNGTGEVHLLTIATKYPRSHSPQPASSLPEALVELLACHPCRFSLRSVPSRAVR